MSINTHTTQFIRFLKNTATAPVYRSFVLSIQLCIQLSLGFLFRFISSYFRNPLHNHTVKKTLFPAQVVEFRIRMLVPA